MIDYAKNIQAFYERDDYKALAGQPGATAVEASFKDLTYVPRKTKPLPGMMAGTMLQEFALQPAQPTALYLHIPFCNLRCSYCSFYRNPFDAEQVEEYVQALLAELDFLQQQGVFAKQRPEAVFFGGGTPSVLNPAQISALLNKIHSVASLADDCEVTFESSIYDLSADKLDACIAGGVNRFSFGVQTFDTHLRRSLGRLNAKEEVTAKLEEVAAKDVKVIIDLIYGLNGQTQAMLLDDIRTALACGVSGMDLYKLQIMPKSPLGQAIAKGNIKYEYNDRMLAEMFVAADALLAEQGAKALSCCHCNVLQSLRRTLLEQGAKALSCCHWAMREDERSGYNTLVKSGANIITCGAACGGHMGMYNYMKTMDRSDYVKKAMSGQYAVMGMGKHNENYLLLEKLSGQCDCGRFDFALLKQYSDADWESLLTPLLEQWELLDLLYAVDGKYYFTAKGKYYYRQMDRVLLTAAECALYGKPGLMEQAGQKMMGIMKNMK